MNQDTLSDFSAIAKTITIGRLYEHYKGLRYKIIGIARHSETLEELVVYQALYGEGGIWVRPLAMFTRKYYDQWKLETKIQISSIAFFFPVSTFPHRLTNEWNKPPANEQFFLHRQI